MLYTNAKQRFSVLSKSDKLNTSYPVTPSHWKQYKKNCELEYTEKDMCFYLHIPFCLSLCKFCEYVKYPKPQKELQQKYVDILKKDILNFITTHPNINLIGLDIGGGTPTCLDNEVFEDLMKFTKTILKKLKLAQNFEPSIEATFLTINERKIKAIKSAGINRISFGIQTVNKKFLKDNNRQNPTLNKMIETFDLCQKNNIKKINIDFMYGLQNQTKKDLQNNLALIEFFMPSQVTLYEFRTNILNIKEYKTKNQLFAQYKYLYKKLKKLGYYCDFGQNTFSLDKKDLGLSSYLRNRMINFTSYKGFGISSQSKSNQGISYNIGKNAKNLENCIKNNTFNSEDTYILPKDEMLAKFVAVSGYFGKIKLDIMEDILNQNPKQYFEQEINFLLSRKLIKLLDNQIVITPKGFKHYGAVLAMFYPQNYLD